MKIKWGKIAQNLYSGPITPIIELNGDLMAMYIFTKFGAEWLIVVDARV